MFSNLSYLIAVVSTERRDLAVLGDIGEMMHLGEIESKWIDANSFVKLFRLGLSGIVSGLGGARYFRGELRFELIFDRSVALVLKFTS